MNQVEILMVEDNAADARLTQEALKEGRLRNNLHIVRDGVEAMQFLRREGAFARAPEPDIVLLDLNLPRMDGRDVLAEMKSDENLMHIPVVVLTTSQAEQDIVKSYQLHANCYVTKPVDLQRFIEIVQQIETFWLSIVRLPHGDRTSRAHGSAKR